MDYWTILGLKAGATQEEIKKAYRQLVKQCHPDRNPGDTEAATAKFLKIQEAYDALTGQSTPKTTYNAYKPKPEPAPKTQTKHKFHKRDFTIMDAPPPKFDIWGKPLSREEQVEWAMNNVGSGSKPPIKKNGFIDIQKYEGGASPEIR